MYNYLYGIIFQDRRLNSLKFVQRCTIIYTELFFKIKRGGSILERIPTWNMERGIAGIRFDYISGSNELQPDQKAIILIACIK